MMVSDVAQIEMAVCYSKILLDHQRFLWSNVIVMDCESGDRSDVLNSEFILSYTLCAADGVYAGGLSV